MTQTLGAESLLRSASSSGELGVAEKSYIPENEPPVLQFNLFVPFVYCFEILAEGRVRGDWGPNWRVVSYLNAVGDHPNSGRSTRGCQMAYPCRTRENRIFGSRLGRVPHYAFGGVCLLVFFAVQSEKVRRRLTDRYRANVIDRQMEAGPACWQGLFSDDICRLDKGVLQFIYNTNAINQGGSSGIRGFRVPLPRPGA
jgi:hypothetical protein